MGSSVQDGRGIGEDGGPDAVFDEMPDGKQGGTLIQPGRLTRGEGSLAGERD